MRRSPLSGRVASRSRRRPSSGAKRPRSGTRCGTWLPGAPRPRAPSAPPQLQPPPPPSPQRAALADGAAPSPPPRPSRARPGGPAVGGRGHAPTHPRPPRLPAAARVEEIVGRSAEATRAPRTRALRSAGPASRLARWRPASRPLPLPRGARDSERAGAVGGALGVPERWVPVSWVSGCWSVSALFLPTASPSSLQ